MSYSTVKARLPDLYIGAAVEKKTAQSSISQPQAALRHSLPLTSSPAELSRSPNNGSGLASPVSSSPVVGTIPPDEVDPTRETLFSHNKKKKPLSVAKGNGRPTLLLQMERYINRELDALTEACGGQPQPSQERLQIFKDCMSMFINNFTVYGPILERIMQEYDLFCLYLYRMEDNLIHEQKQMEEEWKSQASQQLAAAESRWHQHEIDLSEEIEDVKHKNKKLQQQIKQMGQENTHLAKMMKEDHERNVLLSGSIVEYRMQHQHDEKEVEKYQDLLNEMKTLKSQHNEVLWKLEEARGQVHIESLKAEYTTDRVNELTNENEEFKKQVKLLKQTNQQLKHKANKYSDECTTLIKQVERLHRTISTFEGNPELLTPRPCWEDYTDNLWAEHQKKHIFHSFEKEYALKETNKDAATKSEQELEDLRLQKEQEAAIQAKLGIKTVVCKSDGPTLGNFKHWMPTVKSTDMVESLWDCIFNLKNANNELVLDLTKLEKVRTYLEFNAEEGGKLEKEAHETESSGRCFVARGTGKDVPRYLQHHGKIQNLAFSKAQTETFLKGFWDAKMAYDKECVTRGTDVVPPETFLYSYCLSVEGNHHGVVVFCYNLLDACARYSSDPDCSLFLRIINGEFSQQAYIDQCQMLDKLKRALERAETSDSNPDGTSKRFTTGKLTKKAFYSALAAFFKTKGKDNLERLKFAANHDQPSKLVSYNELFAEDENGTQGKFLELVRYQHLEEILEYVADINEALLQVSEDGATIAISDIPAVLSEVDPNKGGAEISQMLENGAGDQIDQGVSSTMVDIPRFCKNLTLGFTKRVTPKDAVTAVLEMKGIEKIAEQRGLSNRRKSMAPILSLNLEHSDVNKTTTKKLKRKSKAKVVVAGNAGKS